MLSYMLTSTRVSQTVSGLSYVCVSLNTGKESAVPAVRGALTAIRFYTGVSSTLAAMAQDPEAVITEDAAVVTAQLVSPGV